MKTALISVFYKDGLFELAKTLVEKNWRILSTGGTLQFLRDHQIEATDVTEITKFEEILGGRVKTLSPMIFSGILYRRSNEDDVKTLERLGIDSIDMVVNVLYPFQETVSNPSSTKEEIIEKIDIGGPSMIRAAAKNFKDVAVVTDPNQYEKVVHELRKDEGITLDFRKQLAKEAFIKTASYDIDIANYFMDELEEGFPGVLFQHLQKKSDLRYGENPHQQAAHYVDQTVEGTLNDGVILQGKELSFNNINDITAAIDFIQDFTGDPTAIAIKHCNPCGAAQDKNIHVAFDKCYNADSQSIFGGIVVMNRDIDEILAKKLTSFYLEVVIAPGFSEQALKVFSTKPNLRVIQIPSLLKRSGGFDFKRASGGLIVQTKDWELYESLMVATETKPTEEQMKNMIFAYKVSKLAKSNSVVLVKNMATVGIGLGDVNRYLATQKAIQMAREESIGAVAGSDGFFPFADCVTALHEAGVSAVIQPGGSIKDHLSIEAANQYHMAMITAGKRHFRH